MTIDLSRRQLALAAAACAAAYVLFSLAVASHALDAADLRVNAWVLQNAGDDFLGVPWHTWTSVGGSTASTAAVGLGAFLAWRAGAARTAVVILAAALLGGVLVDGLKAIHARPYPGGFGAYVVADTNATACPEGTRCRVELRENSTVYCPPGSRCDFYVANGTAWREGRAAFVPADPTVFPDRPGRAYPSGHAMGATASWGAALLLGVRALQRRRGLDPGAVGAWAAIALVGGVSRLPVHAHWWSDVVGAWLLGLCLVALAVLVDDGWRERAERKRAASPPARP